MVIGNAGSALKPVSHFLILMAIVFVGAFSITLMSFVFALSAKAQTADEAIIIVLDGEPLGVMSEVRYQIEARRIEVDMPDTVWTTCRQDRIFHDRFSHLESNSEPLSIIINGENLGTMRRFEYFISSKQIWIFSEEGVTCQAA